MEVPTPLPSALVFLALALPGVWLAGGSLARRANVSAQVRALLTPALAVAAWLLAVHVAGRLTASFTRGLCAGTLVVALAGVAAWLRGRASGDRAAAAPPARLPLRMWLGAGLATAVVVPVALRWAIHDEVLPLGHMSIAAQIQNDVYPPRFIAFPDVELRYHYGFDVVVAVVTALTRLRVDHAIDAVTIASFLYTWCLLWLAGERFVGRGRGNLVALLTLFGGGLLFYGTADETTRMTPYLGPRGLDGLWFNPPVFSYFFQHPFTLGLPIAAAVLLLVTDRGSRDVWRYLALGLLLVALSLSQIVLYLTVTGAVLVQEALSGPGSRSARPLSAALQGHFSRGRLFGAALVAGICLFAATRLGGFFARTTGALRSDLVFHPGITNSIPGSFKWLAGTFGLLLPLGLWGLFVLRRARPFLGALVLGCLAVLFSVRHAHGWNIVKFATVAALALSIASGAAVARILSLRALGRPLGALVIAGTVASGVAIATILALDIRGIPSVWARSAPKLSAPDLEALGWLRGHIKPGEIVYRNLTALHGYAIWGGVPEPWMGHDDSVQFGFTRARRNARARVLSTLPEDTGAYLREGIRWFVLDPRDQRLNMNADGWIEDGAARERARFGRLRIVELVATPEGARKAAQVEEEEAPEEEESGASAED
jgi:hypothetical protein